MKLIVIFSPTTYCGTYEKERQRERPGDREREIYWKSRHNKTKHERGKKREIN